MIKKVPNKYLEEDDPESEMEEIISG